VSNIEKLIGSLSEAATPVRPLRHPLLRAALWLVFAMSVIVGLAYIKGIHHDLGLRFSRREFELEWIASVLTGFGATLAAFYVSMPDRSPWWSILPVPGLAMWLFATGYGCYADWIRLGPNGFILGTSFECLGFIALSTIPLSAVLLYLLRYAAPVRPVLTTILATFSVAALGGAGQSLTHHFDTTLMILAWHAGTTALLLGLARLLGPRYLQGLWRSTIPGGFVPMPSDAS
jgi:hypothetical protein